MFQTIHFREPVISAKPKFLALTVYGYWCCQVTILLAYYASVYITISLFLCYNVTSL